MDFCKGCGDDYTGCEGLRMFTNWYPELTRAEEPHFGFDRVCEECARELADEIQADMWARA